MANIVQINKIDREIHNLCNMYSVAKIKIGMELAKRLHEVESGKLYLKIDEKAYPNFNSYISSLGMTYQGCRELISTYQAFILSAGYSIDDLSKINYHKLAVIKPELFHKKDGKYIMTKTKTEMNRWIADAKSDISINDLKQKRRELSIGEHKHEFEIITYRRCVQCGLRTK